MERAMEKPLRICQHSIKKPVEMLARMNMPTAVSSSLTIPVPDCACSRPLANLIAHAYLIVFGEQETACMLVILTN